MASRFRSISRPAFSLLKSSVTQSRISTASASSCRPHSIPRVSRAVRSLQSLLPLHTAVSSARLTSRIGFDAAESSRLLYQELGISVPR
ncbi:uncharacterized protein LOC110097879 isoform X2 [Dendrobium catenatum]|uniref:uncharacterized protein LOC110097879 isoform X2 n=1 Tax=Dendrobium catenatum TaxID=906689 RepID=UPI0009F56CEB|nr:uncharacterized protein LOC110097879 isoform X2 [Dendrobium catenatum]